MNKTLLAIIPLTLALATASGPTRAEEPAASLTTPGAETTPATLLQRQDVQQFLKEMVKKHAFKMDELQPLFEQVMLRPDIIEAITRPAEAKPWYEYRKIFMTEKRIAGGVEFWDQHQDLLAKAELEYGVPAEIIVAIIGVETQYGRQRGKYRVMDALATLAFDFPPRSPFFRKELEEFLLMAREEQVDPLALLGSYAGAMGQPQFMPSSFRSYAVDFDQDGKRDLWDTPADVIGSVAHYMKTHGWEKGQPIVVAASHDAPPAAELIAKGLKPHVTIKHLATLGIKPQDELPASTRAALIELQLAEGSEYWLGLNNFYVITRYNRSPLYAMAAIQLGAEVKTRRLSKITPAP
ncbi:MAG: lytic murein transglycosylase B [Gammaproteobacteria bacterium]|nr:lytic murein transglycosylase B [Gammaproteobacteria bacterium]